MEAFRFTAFFPVASRSWAVQGRAVNGRGLCTAARPVDAFGMEGGLPHEVPGDQAGIRERVDREAEGRGSGLRGAATAGRGRNGIAPRDAVPAHGLQTRARGQPLHRCRRDPGPAGVRDQEVFVKRAVVVVVVAARQGAAGEAETRVARPGRPHVPGRPRRGRPRSASSRSPGIVLGSRHVRRRAMSACPRPCSTSAASNAAPSGSGAIKRVLLDREERAVLAAWQQDEGFGEGRHSRPRGVGFRSDQRPQHRRRAGKRRAAPAGDRPGIVTAATRCGPRRAAARPGTRRCCPAPASP